MIHNTAHRGSAGSICITKFDVEDFFTYTFLSEKGRK